MLTLLDLTVGGTTYQYSDQPHESYPDHAPRMNLYSEIDIMAADIQQGTQQQTVCRVYLSNTVLARYSTSHPTILELINAGNTVLGATARVRKVDARSNTVQHDFTGRVVQVGDFAEQYVSLVVQVHVEVDRSILIPFLRVRDVFPLAPAPDTAAIPWIFGHAKKLALYPVSNDDVVRFAAATTQAGDAEIVYTLTGYDALTIAEGDYLQYEIAIGAIRGANESFRMFLDIGTATEWLSDVADQTDELGNAVDFDQFREDPGVFRQRTFTLPDTWDTLEVTRIRLVAIPGQDSAGDLDTKGIEGFFARARIFDVAGQSKLEIIQTDLTYMGMGPNDDDDYSLFEAIDTPQFGAWRDAVVVETAAYIDGLRVAPDVMGVPGAGFVIGGDDGLFGDTDVGILSFNSETGDFDELTTPIQLDVIGQQFGLNPADALCWVLQQLGYGVDGVTHAAARTVYQTLGIEIGGALEQRTAAQEVLSQMLLHGTSLQHGSSGVEILVDTADQHPQASIELGAGDAAGWNNFEVSSIQVSAPPAGFFLQAGYDPGFPDDEARWTGHSETGVLTSENVYRAELPFVADVGTLGREAQYRWDRLQQRDLLIVGTIQAEEYGADTLRFGQRIFCAIPRRGIARQEFEIIGWAQTQDAIELTLTPWVGEIFTNAALPVIGAIPPNQFIPKGQTVPDQPDMVTVSRENVTAPGIQFVRLTFGGTVPDQNISHLYVEVSLLSGLGNFDFDFSYNDSGTIRRPFDPANSMIFHEIAPGATVDLRRGYSAGGLLHTRDLYVRIQSFQQDNLAGFQYSPVREFQLVP